MKNSWILLLWGAPAAGKSTLARKIAEGYRLRFGQELCHLGTDRLNAALIGEEFDGQIRDSLYRGILEMASGIASGGRPILVEGTYLDREKREALGRVAQSHGHRFLSVLIECRLSLRLKRNSRRGVSEFVPDKFLARSHQEAWNARPEADFVFDTELVQAPSLAEFLLQDLCFETAEECSSQNVSFCSTRSRRRRKLRIS